MPFRRARRALCARAHSRESRWCGFSARPTRPRWRKWYSTAQGRAVQGTAGRDGEREANEFSNYEEREKGFEPSTLALASRLGAIPGGTDALQDFPTLRHSERLGPPAASNGTQVSQRIPCS